MNKEVLAHVVAFNVNRGWSDDEEEAISTIREYCHAIWSGDPVERRWWTEKFFVVEIGGRLIGYVDGVTTGDDSAEDKGFEFDPDTICWAEPVEVTVTNYVPKT